MGEGSLSARLILGSYHSVGFGLGRKNRPLAVFSYWEQKPVRMHRVKTIFYVDGYNLYYGCLKGTPYKWLDIYRLFSHILHAQSPSSELIQIKFFTSPIKTKLASHGELAGIAQADYHRALQQEYGAKFVLIEGFFSLTEGQLLEYRNPPDKTKRIKVWRLEEKQTDVNIAISAYRDAAKGEAEQIVFVSNDSDLAPALQAIREDFGARTTIGVIFPIAEKKHNNSARPENDSLRKSANWTRSYIRDEELASNLLRDIIPTKKKPIRKPAYW